MSKHATFDLKTLHDLRLALAGLNLTLPIEEDLSVLADRVTIGCRETTNRFVIQPMEGFDSTPHGAPTELSFRRYGRYARGGSALLWFEATAVLEEGRSNPRQFWLHQANLGVYRRLVEQTRRLARETFGHELVLVLQLTHSGRYSKPLQAPAAMIAHHSKVLDPRGNLPDDYPLVTDEYLDRLQDRFVSTAKLAAAAGFDGVDVKSCHGYLISELLASHTRPGKYGGCLENRSRMLRQTMGKIHHEVPELFVATRMNVFDAVSYPYGFGVDRHDYRLADATEPIELIGRLRETGMPLLNVTIGNPYFNPHYNRPYDRAVVGHPAADDNPLGGVVRFIDVTRRIQEAYPELPVVGSGYGWLRHLMPQVAAGVIQSGSATLIGQGRGAFAYPDSPRDVFATGRMDPEKTCLTCSACTQIMRDGGMTGCVVRDAEIYARQFKLGRRRASADS